jgi:hypothetical protein
MYEPNSDFVWRGGIEIASLFNLPDAISSNAFATTA